MGNISRRKSSQILKELSNEQLENLLNNTSFDKDQILDWHKGFLVFDTDNSEYIDFTELMIAVSITSMGDLRKKITLAFVIYDIDKSGSIDQAEMTTLLQALYILLNYDDIIQCGWDSDEKVKQIMTHLDINHDGVVSKEEFIEGCLNDKEICSLFGFL